MLIEIGVLVFTLLVLVIYYISSANRRNKIELAGKHCVITGGSSGIGWDICVQALQQGAHVSIVARNLTRLNSIKNELEDMKKKNPKMSEQRVNIESVDISANYEMTKKAFDRLVKRAGPVDVLINNAGIFKCSEFSETTANEFDDMIRINYTGSVYCTKAVVDSMKERKSGRIVFVSSQAGQIGVFGYSAYSSTKFALRGLAECLQMELKPFNIFITLSYPPDTNTPGLESENLTKPEETKAIAESSGLLEPKVVAKSILTGLKNGSFSCSYGINGFLLTTLTAGAGPATTFTEAMIQIITLPLCRLVAIFLLFDFDRLIKNCKDKKNKK